MLNIDMLIDTISQHLTNTQNGQQAYFTTLELKYAYSQLKLHHDIAKHCKLFLESPLAPIESKLDSTALLTCR